jgi:cell division septation protein DedD
VAAETHEPSYYEIALTNRQVVVAFVLLLTCVLGAFLSGVWVGREGTARAAQEQMVRNSPPQVAQEGKNLDELEFFDARKKKGEGRPAKQEAVAAPPASSTLFDDLNRRKKNDEPAPAQTAPAPAPTQVAPPAPAPARAEPAADPDGLTKAERRKQRRERQKAAEAAAAAATTAPTTVPAPAKSSAAKTAAEPAVPKGSYVIQVFSSADKVQADSIRAKLAGGGQKAYLSPIDRGGRTMYRVRIGPFKSRGDAQTVADKVRKGYKLDTWVTE